MHVVSVSGDARAVSSLLATQLRRDPETAAAVTTHTFDFVNQPGHVTTAVSTLTGLSVAGVGVHVIVDEADSVIPR